MNGARAGRLVVAPAALHGAAFAVHVPRPHPVGEGLVGPLFTPSLWCRIEIPVDTEELFTAAAIRRIGVEDLSSVVLEEHTVAGAVLQPGIHVLIVVEGSVRVDLFVTERNVEIIVE